MCTPRQNSLYIVGSHFTCDFLYTNISPHNEVEREREICISQFKKPANMYRAFPFQWSRGWTIIPSDPSTGRLSKTGCDQNKGIRGTETVRDWGNPITHPLRFQWTQSGKQKIQSYGAVATHAGQNTGGCSYKVSQQSRWKVPMCNKKQPLHSKYQFT